MKSHVLNVFVAVELTRRLRQRNPKTKVTINSLHPGVVNTNLIRSPVYTKFLKYVIYRKYLKKLRENYSKIAKILTGKI